MADDNKEPKQRTLYDVLGVPPTARNTDIARAFNRLKADQQREDVSPDARLMAQAQVAFDTLSDPARRDAYDASLARAASKSRVPMWTAIGVAIAVAAGGGYFATNRARVADVPKPMAREEVLKEVGPYVGELKGALMSGEVKAIGEAVVVAEDRMATSCKGFMPGAQLTMKVGDYSTTASLTRADEALDVCVLAVASMGTPVKLRQNMPAPRAAVHAIVVDASGKPQVRQATISGFVDDANGTLMQVSSAVPLPNGTPVFDDQARLAGIVTSPHTFGENVIIAVPAMRILQAKNAAAAATTVPPPSASSEGKPVPSKATGSEVEDAKADLARPQANARQKAEETHAKMIDEVEQRDGK